MNITARDYDNALRKGHATLNEITHAEVTPLFTADTIFGTGLLRSEAGIAIVVPA